MPPIATVLFIHSAGPQGDGDGSAPLAAALERALAGHADFRAPLMPAPEAPSAEAWDTTLAGLVAPLSGPLVLVGHSLGGSTILKYLAERPMPPGLAGVVVIAAPYWSAPDWAVDEYALPAGCGPKLAEIPRLVFYHSRDDEVVETAHLYRYAALLPGAETREVDGRGHLFDSAEADDIAADIRAMLGSAQADRPGR